MESSRELFLKKRLESLCDRMFSPQRAAVAKDDVIYWILRHPDLYIKGSTLDFYLITSEGERLSEANLFDYVTYATMKKDDSGGGGVSREEKFEAIAAELKQQQEQSKKRKK